jgi:shikimate kinase
MKSRPGSRHAVRPLRPKSGGARTIFLVGFMGAGKTSVGQALSRRLHWTFEDLDDRIQSREGRTIEAIFRDSGEAGFRQAENAALREVLASPNAGHRIVALGGGAFVQAENLAMIEDADLPTVFLEAPVEELFRRCGQESQVRPLCRDAEQFRELYESRRDSYMKVTCRIETNGKDVETVAAEVACRLGIG